MRLAQRCRQRQSPADRAAARFHRQDQLTTKDDALLSAPLHHQPCNAAVRPAHAARGENRSRPGPTEGRHPDHLRPGGTELRRRRCFPQAPMSSPRAASRVRPGDEPAAEPGSRKPASSTTRTGERPSMPGNRHVSWGSSASTVPTPIRTASFMARRVRCTCARAPSPVIAAGLRPASPALAVSGHRELQGDVGTPVPHAAEMAGMGAPSGFPPRRAPPRRRCHGRRRAERGPAPQPPDWDPRWPRPPARCRRR